MISPLGAFILWVTTGCSPSASDFPDIIDWASTPSSQFIIDSDGWEHVSRAFPFKGEASDCPHSGAHLHFEGGQTETYLVDLYAPADGTVDRIDTCSTVEDDQGNSNDKFDLTLAFARTGNELITFNYSVEPMAGILCSGGDSDYFEPFIYVKSGDEVKSGQLLATLVRLPGDSDNTHLHFNLKNETSDQDVCPNIFNQEVTDTFYSHFGSETCNGTQYPATFCYDGNAVEDLTGL